MTAPPILPDNAPFTAEQRAWLNGYLAGLLAAAPAPGGRSADTPKPSPTRPLRIAFGSQTGTAATLARRIAREAGTRGFAATVEELNTVSTAALADGTPCVVVTSTWGDGDPPDNATAFWDRIQAADAPRLETLAFAVLALGDRNYPEFCGAGRKFDERLAALGGRRMVPRGECDTDPEPVVPGWLDQLWTALAGADTAVPAPATNPSASPAPGGRNTATASAGPSRKNPFPARLKASRCLSRPGSAKDIRHHEIDLTGSGLTYTAGDALGVFAENRADLVANLLEALGLDGSEPATDSEDRSHPLQEWLTRRLVLTAAPPALVREAATRSGNTDLLRLLEPDRKADLEAWLHGRDVLDVLRACPGASFQPRELTSLLRPLQPRLYSISSSPGAHPGEVHLTVGTVRYEAHGRARTGVASGWLADAVVPGVTPVPVFLQVSSGFRLPADPATPIIMVGPGTGIAPFRAFLEERRLVGAPGRNWLFFGDQQRAFDFLYEDELTAWAADGHLARLDLAFSRDQERKVYVQDRMGENARELFDWLEAGAHFYVCGDARRMARDVDAALHGIIATAGGRTPEQAAEYVAALKSARRYQRDVY